MIANWLLRWQRKRPEPSPLPLGLTDADIDGLKHLISLPSWKHYVRALNALGEQQAAELASGLPHDKYLFTAGSLVALRRVFTLADDVIAAAQTLKEHEHDRTRRSADRAVRHAASFVNTPWYDSWRRSG